MRGLRGWLLSFGKRQYGYVPGLSQVLLPDLVVTIGAGIIYNRLHMSKSSSMSRLQREMLATVVNGRVGGAP